MTREAKSGKSRNGDYEVGYGRPPRNRQFLPGRSGNPRGRPKKKEPGVMDVPGAMRAAFSEMVTVNVNGRNRRMTLLDASMHKLARQFATDPIRHRKMIPDITALARISPEPSSSGRDHGAEIRAKLLQIAENREAEEKRQQEWEARQAQREERARPDEDDALL